MEDLPSDVVLAVARKLAAQDPLSLLRAACACKAVHRTTEENPVIWKEVFHGSLLDEDTRLKRQGTCELLDGEIEALGGYKKLVTARFFEQGRPAKRRLPEQTQAEIEWHPVKRRADGTEKRLSFGFKETSRILALVRLRGRLVLWGADDNFKRDGFDRYAIAAQLLEFKGRGCYHHTFYEIGDLRIKPVYTYPTDHFLKAIRKERLSCSCGVDSRSRTGQCEAASLEILEFQSRQQSVGASFELLRILAGSLQTLGHGSPSRSKPGALQLEGTLEPAYRRGEYVAKTVYTHLPTTLVLGDRPSEDPLKAIEDPVRAELYSSALLEDLVVRDLKLTLSLSGLTSQTWRSEPPVTKIRDLVIQDFWT